MAAEGDVPRGLPKKARVLDDGPHPAERPAGARWVAFTDVHAYR